MQISKARQSFTGEAALLLDAAAAAKATEMGKPMVKTWVQIA